MKQETVCSRPNSSFEWSQKPWNQLETWDLVTIMNTSGALCFLFALDLMWEIACGRHCLVCFKIQKKSWSLELTAHTSEEAVRGSGRLVLTIDKTGIWLHWTLWYSYYRSYYRRLSAQGGRLTQSSFSRGHKMEKIIVKHSICPLD